MPEIQTLVLLILALLATGLIWLAWRDGRGRLLWRSCSPGRRRRLLTLRLARLRRDTAKLQRQNMFYRLVSESVSDGLVIQSLDGKIIWANPAFCRMTGQRLDNIIGRKPQHFVFPPDLRPPEDEIEAFRYDPEKDHLGLLRKRNIRADGTEFWNELSISFRAGLDGRVLALLCCRDVTDQVAREQQLREASARLEHEASHDALTGLANRAALLDFAAGACRSADGRLGILHVDLDRFKDINDTHGHSAGDAVLIHVARALSAAIRPGDLAARLGGDEFVIACPGLGSLEDLRAIGDRISARIAEPCHWADRVLTITASIGADLAPAGAVDVEGLFQRSDFALYEAKRAGRDQLAAYDEGVHDRYVQTQELAADLRAAIRDKTLGFAFQPILDLGTGTICTLETLVRWNHPRAGPLSPGAFLPLAEDLGLMADVDFLAMEAALDLKARLTVLGHASLTVALNASSSLLAHPDFPPRLAQGMAERGLNPAEIGIEVLETVMFEAPGSKDLATELISVLRGRGHPVMLDDFGVGYAGLAHLANLEVSGIKIDLSLVQAAKTDPTSVQILESLIELCSKLGITSVAEGVDTVWMATRLQDMGCSRLQGWWLSPALPAEGIIDWLGGQATPAPVAEAQGTG